MKTCVVYHSIDLDGWMSAAIVKHWWMSNIGDKPYTFTAWEDLSNTEHDAEVLNMIGYNYGQPIPDLSEYDKVIMCDISFTKDQMIQLVNQFSNLENFIWIDHHISAIKELNSFTANNTIYHLKHLEGLRDTTFAACELTWKYFFPNETMPEIVRLLGMYDSFRHKGTDEEQKVLEFQYGARQCIKDYFDAYEHLLGCNIETILQRGYSIYQYLCSEAKQIYKNGFEIILIEQCGFRIEEQIPRKFICINKERFNPINFGIDYHKDGYDGAACFHYANGKWNFSLYNGNGLVDCSVIAKQFGGGGHFSASGFVCDNKTFLKLINQ